jgi:hypothetical protein
MKDFLLTYSVCKEDVFLEGWYFETDHECDHCKTMCCLNCDESPEGTEFWLEPCLGQPQKTP